MNNIREDISSSIDKDSVKDYKEKLKTVENTAEPKKMNFKLYRMLFYIIVTVIVLLFFKIPYQVLTLIPLSVSVMGIFLFIQIAGKAIKSPSKFFIPACSIMVGHALLFLSYVIFANDFKSFGIDICILVGGIIWLLIRPNISPVIIITIYKVIAILFNVANFEFNSTLHNASLIVHILLRISTIILLFIGLQRYKAKMHKVDFPDGSF
jgi:hypothetical protein